MVVVGARGTHEPMEVDHGFHFADAPARRKTNETVKADVDDRIVETARAFLVAADGLITARSDLALFAARRQYLRAHAAMAERVEAVLVRVRDTEEGLDAAATDGNALVGRNAGTTPGAAAERTGFDRIDGFDHLGCLMSCHEGNLSERVRLVSLKTGQEDTPLPNQDVPQSANSSSERDLVDAAE